MTRRKLVTPLLSMMMSIVMVVGSTVPAYAAESTEMTEVAEVAEDAALEVPVKQVGSYAMVPCGTTSNGTQLYFFDGQRPDDWYWIVTAYPGWRSETGEWIPTAEPYKIYYPKYDDLNCWPQYLLDYMDKSGVSPEMSDYEKATTVARYISQTISYYDDGLGNYNTTLFALTTGHTKCGGYSNLFEDMMQMLGIECYYVRGKANGGCHSWNRVVINGNDYYIDTTWMRNMGDRYLMMSYDLMSIDHDVTRECESTLNEQLAEW